MAVRTIKTRTPTSDDDVAAARLALFAALEAGSSKSHVNALLQRWHLLVKAQDDERAGVGAGPVD